MGPSNGKDVFLYIILELPTLPTANCQLPTFANSCQPQPQSQRVKMNRWQGFARIGKSWQKLAVGKVGNLDII